ncbi:Beta-lactamase class C and other penicillin binding proteins [plant metagenome]|uniref:Beta-lactamase class C and other penicillin binding proteins n=1 Tax=plant metagenome TaxID=1297885 RepID=A0A484S5S2_9ZZZZ
MTNPPLFLRQGVPPAHLGTRIQSTIQQALDDQRLVGAVILVARDGELIHQQAAGFADRESARPMTLEAVFRLASVSKPIVSAAALALVAQGRLDLDAGIERWLPDFQPRLADGRSARITARQLLSHTAGLGYRFFEADAAGPYAWAGVSDGMDASGISLEENLRRLASVPLLYEPGTAWGYSLATDVLGALIARVHGTPLDEAVCQLVTGPLGMVDTGFVARDPQRVATAYVNDAPQPHRLADMAGGQMGWNQIAEGMALRQAVASTDAVSAIEQAETSRGNDGVPWVGGNNADGAGQSAIRVVGDVTRAGYNLVNGRGVSDSSAIATASCTTLSCQAWSSPQQAVEWATRVLGEQEQRTCEACTKTQTVPGVGLTPLIQEEYETKLTALQELINGSRTTSFDNLREAGSASLPITRGVVEALRDEPDQDVLARRLASEVALASVLEKALLLQRTLLTGKKEPNVAANSLAVEAVNQESDTLDREILNLKTELELRRTLANNSPMSIIQRHGARAAGSRGVYEGDPVPDRLDRLQRPPAGNNP